VVKAFADGLKAAGKSAMAANVAAPRKLLKLLNAMLGENLRRDQLNVVKAIETQHSRFEVPQARLRRIDHPSFFLLRVFLRALRAFASDSSDSDLAFDHSPP
jgi:hypothetical protein